MKPKLKVKRLSTTQSCGEVYEWTGGTLKKVKRTGKRLTKRKMNTTSNMLNNM